MYYDAAKSLHDELPHAPKVVAGIPLAFVARHPSADSPPTLQHRVQDYITMGVPTIWVVDPWNRVAYYASAHGYIRPTDGFLRLPGTEAATSLEEMFGELIVA